MPILIADSKFRRLAEEMTCLFDVPSGWAGVKRGYTPSDPIGTNMAQLAFLTERII